MQLRVVTMRYDESTPGFSDEAVRKICNGFEVLDASEHFFTHGGIPHIALVLKVAEKRRGKWSQDGDRSDWKKKDDAEKSLPKELRPVFREIRSWRGERAREEGVSAYQVARNTQVFEILKAMPQTLAELREIEGIGDAFVRKYGSGEARPHAACAHLISKGAWES